MPGDIRDFSQQIDAWKARLIGSIHVQRSARADIDPACSIPYLYKDDWICPGDGLIFPGLIELIAFLRDDWGFGCKCSVLVLRSNDRLPGAVNLLVQQV